MRSDVGSIPLMCILSVLTSNVFGYLPNEDLTNSLPNSILTVDGYPEGIIPGEAIDEDGRSREGDIESDTDSIYRKKSSSFRRRNINPYGTRVPFGRMSYKSGYGSNRFNMGSSRNMLHSGGGMYERERNPYGTVNLGGGYQPRPDEYNVRPSPPYSGLIGGSRSGYYGSAAGIRRPMTKPKVPSDFQPDYPSNDLMGSFGNGGGSLPSLRELATYASRYGPSYLRERFGASDSLAERPQSYRGGLNIPHVPREGGGAPDFSYNIASNKWNSSPIGIMSRDMDSYQHDDVKKSKKQPGSTTTTTTKKPTTGAENGKARKAKSKRSKAKKSEKSTA